MGFFCTIINYVYYLTFGFHKTCQIQINMCKRENFLKLNTPQHDINILATLKYRNYIPSIQYISMYIRIFQRDFISLSPQPQNKTIFIVKGYKTSH